MSCLRFPACRIRSPAWCLLPDAGWMHPYPGFAGRLAARDPLRQAALPGVPRLGPVADLRLTAQRPPAGVRGEAEGWVAGEVVIRSILHTCAKKGGLRLQSGAAEH